MSRARTESSPPRFVGSEPDAGIFNVVVGTAGHIDHGKSLLVRALTGVDTDRLKEERERGITIDLGFAPLELPGGRRAGVIDVPGHERFIKNMVAGSTSMDFVLLVVAADDGVMAQTREHLQIIRLLGVPDGLVAVTKIDLVEPDFVELVRGELAELTRGSCLEGKPVVPVSAKTGAGLERLRTELETALGKLRRRDGGGPFRMPIQRVFAKEGFGAVITGVPLSGTVALGETLEILPLGVSGRVKGLHAYNRRIERAHAGHSTAVNLAGVERGGMERGMVAVTPGVFRATKRVTAWIEHLPDAPFPLKHRAPVRFHAGTAELMGKVLLPAHDQLLPGERAFVQVLLEEPAVVCPGDRFILRHQSPMRTIGGGKVLSNATRKLKRFDAEALSDLEARRSCLGEPIEFLAHVFDCAASALGLDELCAELGALPEQSRAWLARLVADSRVVELKPGEVYIGLALHAKLARAIGECLAEFFREHPAMVWMEKPALKQALERSVRRQRLGGVAHIDELLASCERAGLLRLRGNEVALPGYERKLDARWAGYARKLEEALREGGRMPPLREELAARLGLSSRDFREVLRYLCETGKAVEVPPEFAYHAHAYAEMLAVTKALFGAGAERTVSEIRQALDLNRKYVVPLVEHFDARGLTRREGNKRRWVAG